MTLPKTHHSSSEGATSESECSISGFLLAAALFLALTLATHLRWLITPLPSDLNLWIRVARDWSAGAPLYVGAFDIKLPPVLLLVRLLNSNDPALTWYLVEAVYTTIAATALFTAMRPAARVAAVVAPILMITWTGINVTGQETEAVALMLDVTALSLCAITARSGRLWLGLVAGACFALMVTFRPPSLLHLVAYVPILWVVYRRHGARFTVRVAGAFLIGATGVVAAAVIHAMAFGYWEPFKEIMRRNAAYASMSRVPFRRSIWMFVDRMRALLIGWQAVALLLMLTFAAAAQQWRTVLSLSRWRLWLVVATLWAAAAALGTFPGGRHFEHYYHTLWGGFAVLGSLWLTIAFPDLRPRPMAWRLAVALSVYTVAYASLQFAHIARKQTKMVPGSNKMVRAVAADLNRLIHPNEVAPVCVWSGWSELIWRVHRPSVSPVLVPILWLDMAPDLLDEWTAAMLAHPPNLIVFDYWAPGPGSGGQVLYKGRPGQEELQAMLRKDYVEIRRWDDLYVLARRGGPYCPANSGYGGTNEIAHPMRGDSSERLCRAR